MGETKEFDTLSFLSPSSTSPPSSTSVFPPSLLLPFFCIGMTWNLGFFWWVEEENGDFSCYAEFVIFLCILRWVDGWMDGWMDGRRDGRRISLMLYCCISVIMRSRNHIGLLIRLFPYCRIGKQESN